MNKNSQVLNKRGDRSRQRRRRTAFTDEQLNRLEDSFENEKFPGIQIREDLAKELSIGEDRIQVWFQNRRARWRKHEIKNKPAPVLPASKTLPYNSDVISPAMFQPSPVIFPPLSQKYFRPWSPVYPPFPASTSMFLPSGTFGPAVFNRNSNFPCAASQTVSVMVRPRVSASASPPFRPSTSPINSLVTQYQVSCDSDNGRSCHTADDYLAAVTLVSGFHREN
ncbi:paired mesoderm homeobox protein 2-like [Orbicella faveolata]|uniref:paired mesoderm homeobox protein 2-like n=1 Tax=Orbicella faveolata TaxID=48498 RepID=UPI0009E49ADD|nr:paired mesoderm homeobox protein 2-like [Orbicella faveolata]